MESASTRASLGELSAALERELVQALRTEWHYLNRTYFGDRLRAPVFALSDTRTQLGRWMHGLRALELSRPLVLERPWGEVVDVLKHEIAHQFVDEILGVDEPPHGPAFSEVCERMGADPAARAQPGRAAAAATGGADGDADPAIARIVRRVRKLMALAESPNQNEAEAAAAAAQELMLRFNIEAEQAAEPPRFGYRHLGRPKGRIFEHERRLAHILGAYYFVDVLWVSVFQAAVGKRATVLEICGTEANLAMAEYVHAFLEQTAERLWTAYKRENGIRKDRDRRAFLAGVMKGFAGKLAAQQRALATRGLIWVPKGQLKEYMRRRHPHTRTVRRSGQQRNGVYAAGETAGRQIVVSRPISQNGSGTPQGLLRGKS